MGPGADGQVPGFDMEVGVHCLLVGVTAENSFGQEPAVLFDGDGLTVAPHGSLSRQWAPQRVRLAVEPHHLIVADEPQPDKTLATPSQVPGGAARACSRCASTPR